MYFSNDACRHLVVTQVQCPPPEAPRHGKAVYTSCAYNSVVSYECKYGYRLVGDATRRCGADKKWSGAQPMCKEINCGHPGQLWNGWLENISSGTGLGASIIFRCQDGMKMEGNGSAVCQSDGSWSYPLPMCLGKCKKMPKFPRNGMVIAPKTEHGMKARFRCKDGFELQGNPIVVCSFGNWSGETPKCAEVFCPFPGYIENGKVLLVGNMGLYDYRPYVKKVVNNKQIMYECEKGYVLSEGAPGATCVGGHWSPRELPKCTLYQHPRIRWSRRRRSIPEPEIRHRRSAYLRQYYTKLRHQTDPEHQYVDQLYEKYNHNKQKPTLRHANFKIMKKFDTDFEDDVTTDDENPENFPTAVYTVYNVHGEPVGHRLYSYQPVYEPEIDTSDDVSEYEDSSESDAANDITVLKGGLFPDHNDSKENINKLKHQYFERYLDKRRKRYLNKSSENDKTELSMELQEDESVIDAKKSKIKTTPRVRRKRNIYHEEFDREHWTIKPTGQVLELNNDIEDLLKVIPLEVKAVNDTAKENSHEMAVIPLQYNKTNSTEVDNILDKREKRTSRKTDRLNQTTAAIPKTGREGKGGRRQQAPDSEENGQNGDGSEGSKTENGEKGKKGRPKSPCEPIESEPYVNIEIVKYGRDPNNTFSSGTIVRVACGKGYGLNLDLNATVKCVRGRWKPEKPKCEILPCHVPSTEYGIYTMAEGAVHTATQVLSGIQEEKELNETDPVPNGQVVQRARTDESPLLAGRVGGYEHAGMRYRAGLTVAHASSVNIACEPGRTPPATLNCHLGRLQPTVHDFCRPLANLSRPRPTSEFQSGSDIVREDISDLEPDMDGTTITECGPPARVQGTLIYKDGAEVNGTCSDIGKYLMLGSQTRRCVGGAWDGVQPTCLGLNQEKDYAMDKPPTILFRYSNGPIAQTNDGKLLVYPGTNLHMECLWMR
ncbi:Sushi, von Willebrand factor type A, EGF and pentraxin domain-containing protein 1, partial [Operophtera brumata]